MPDVHEREACTATSSSVQEISSFDAQRKTSFGEGKGFEIYKNTNENDFNDEIQNLRDNYVSKDMQKHFKQFTLSSNERKHMEDSPID